jgi:hypothetical protein
MTNWYRSWRNDSTCVEINVDAPPGVNYVKGSCSGYYDQVPGAFCQKKEPYLNANVWTGGCTKPANEPYLDQYPAVNYVN